MERDRERERETTIIVIIITFVILVVIVDKDIEKHEGGREGGRERERERERGGGDKDLKLQAVLKRRENHIDPNTDHLSKTQHEARIISLIAAFTPHVSPVCVLRQRGFVH